MDVFVYGTLTSPTRVAELVDSYAFVGPARLDGLHLIVGRAPTLGPGGEAAGRLLRTEAIDRLDRYEGVDHGLYVRVSVPRSDGGEAAVYIGDPDRLDADVTWPGTGTFAERVRAYLDRAAVVVEPVVDR